MPAIEKFVRIFAITVPAFFPREKPISRNAKPACMNITRQPATITHVELIPTLSASFPGGVNVSASAELGTTSAASIARALARTAFFLATVPRNRLFIGVFPPVEARLEAHGDQRPPQARRVLAVGLYPCVENLPRVIRQLVERGSTERSAARPARKPGPAAAPVAPLAARRAGLAALAPAAAARAS